MSRVYNVLTWVNKLIKFCPVTGISQELVRFDDEEDAFVLKSLVFNTSKGLYMVMNCENIF